MNMRAIFYVLFLSAPVILLNYLVMPELARLQDLYAHADTTAQRVVESHDSAPAVTYQSTLLR